MISTGILIWFDAIAFDSFYSAWYFSSQLSFLILQTLVTCGSLITANTGVMMIEFDTDGTTSAKGFRAYFEAGGDGTNCGMMVPASVTDESFDTITAYRGTCPAGFEGPLGGECWPTPAVGP